ncbi:hypothetical protein [Neobacillus sp. NPDC093127]|uniref:hypothetical protein n=1 Tax=Neobacillus sp. NPDC093127 TaxID=3364296 RepID=UPI0037F7AAD3
MQRFEAGGLVSGTRAEKQNNNYLSQSPKYGAGFFLIVEGDYDKYFLRLQNIPTKKYPALWPDTQQKYILKGFARRRCSDFFPRSYYNWQK